MKLNNLGFIFVLSLAMGLGCTQSKQNIGAYLRSANSSNASLQGPNPSPISTPIPTPTPTPTPAPPPQSGAANPPALPQKTVSAMPPENLSGRMIAVHAGMDLQAALNSAQSGDTLVLDAGATWVGNFELPPRTDSGWIAIRGSQESSLPGLGKRVSPANASAMPKIVTPNASPALTGRDGTQGWRIVGIEFTVVPTYTTVVYQLLLLGWGSADWGHHAPTDVIGSRFIVERCYVHGSQTQFVQKGILANGADTRITDSWIEEIHNSGFDSQAILTYDGPGPLLIENNELQASSENIMSGGADSSGPAMIPSDIIIRRNHIMKMLRWKSNDPTFDGHSWVIKPLIELKSAQRVLIEGNTLENSWNWPAFVTDAFNQDGSAPWSIVQDVTFQNNVINKAIAVYQAWAGNAPVKRIKLYNNNAMGISQTFASQPGNAYQLGSFFYLINAEDVWLEHNTAQIVDHSAGFIEVGSLNPRLTMKNNIVGYGSTGFMVSGLWASDDASIAAAAPGYDFAKNAMINVGVALSSIALPYSQSSWNSAEWLLPGTASQAGLNTDGTLNAGPLKGAATDGTDLGVDFARLNAALQ